MNCIFYVLNGFCFILMFIKIDERGLVHLKWLLRDWCMCWYEWMNELHIVYNSVIYLSVSIEASVTVTVGTLLEATDWMSWIEYNIIQTLSQFALAYSLPSASSLWFGVTFIRDKCWPDINGWGNKHTSDNVSDKLSWPACDQDVVSSAL